MRGRIEKFDHAAMQAVIPKRRPLLTAFFRVVTLSGEGRFWGLFIVILGLGIYFNFLRFPHREFTLFAAFAPGIAWVFVRTLKRQWRRRRPFQVWENYPALTRAPLDDSFPSGHTASVFAFLVAMSPLGGVLTGALSVWAGLVSFSRYYLGVHFPSDIIGGALIGIIAGTGIAGIRVAYGADVYPSYTEMAKHEREGTDFHVDTRNRRAEPLVLAIHGGFIEPGSDTVAEAIAGPDWSFYLFRATKNEGYADLHVTSSHFNDPRALHLAQFSPICISVHGYKDRVKEGVCLGGGNAGVRARVEAQLKNALPSVELSENCSALEGVDGNNIVNLCRNQGVQLELSWKLRARLTSDAGAMNRFVRAVRAAVLSPRP